MLAWTLSSRACPRREGIDDLTPPNAHRQWRKGREDPGPRGRSQSVSHVEIGDVQRVCLDEVAARLDEIAHQGGEGLLGRVGVADLDLQQGPNLGVEGR